MEDILLPVLFDLTLEYAIRNVQETDFVLDINGSHQVFFYTNALSLISDNIRIIERNAHESLNACKYICCKYICYRA